MTFTIDNEYGERIGQARSIKDARYQAEQYFQNGLKEPYGETSRWLRKYGFAHVSDITFDVSISINKVA